MEWKVIVHNRFIYVLITYKLTSNQSYQINVVE